MEKENYCLNVVWGVTIGGSLSGWRMIGKHGIWAGCSESVADNYLVAFRGAGSRGIRLPHVEVFGLAVVGDEGGGGLLGFELEFLA